MSGLLHFAEHRLQEAALIFMALVYTKLVLWLLKFPAGKERQAPTGSQNTPKWKGILYSWAIIGMPWVMESSRTKPFLYAQFVIFHIGVTLAIALSFIIPYAPGVLENGTVVLVFQAAIWGACAVGCIRIIRRIISPYMRAISTPDDYFSLTLLTVWMLFAVLAAPNDAASGEGILLAYFFLTAFFLIYVPFSKISHYLYYPFTRFYFGRSMAHRGVFPIPRSVKPPAYEAAAPVQAEATATTRSH